jgi:hypothetical protein
MRTRMRVLREIEDVEKSIKSGEKQMLIGTAKSAKISEATEPSKLKKLAELREELKTAPDVSEKEVNMSTDYQRTRSPLESCFRPHERASCGNNPGPCEEIPEFLRRDPAAKHWSKP